MRRFYSDAERETIRSCYGKMPTRELAARLGRSPKAVYSQACEMGLMTPTHRFGKAERERMRELVAERLCDTCIGRELGFERHIVGHWRQRLGFPAIVNNKGCPRCIAAVREKTREQCAAAGVDSLGDVRVLAFRRYAADCGWPADLRPRAVQILNFLRDNGPSTREMIAAGIGMEWLGSRRSLKSSDPEGSYLANLMARGLVISLGKLAKGRGKGKSVNVYSLALNVEELIDGQAAEIDGPAEASDKRRRLDGDVAGSVV